MVSRKWGKGKYEAVHPSISYKLQLPTTGNDGQAQSKIDAYDELVVERILKSTMPKLLKKIEPQTSVSCLLCVPDSKQITAKWPNGQ